MQNIPSCTQQKVGMLNVPQTFGRRRLTIVVRVKLISKFYCAVLRLFAWLHEYRDGGAPFYYDLLLVLQYASMGTKHNKN